MMSGQIKKMLDQIIELRAKGNKAVAMSTRARLTLKGINLELHTSYSQDDPAIVEKVRRIAQEFGVSLTE
jgi:hypothetical protein